MPFGVAVLKASVTIYALDIAVWSDGTISVFIRLLPSGAKKRHSGCCPFSNPFIPINGHSLEWDVASTASRNHKPPNHMFVTRLVKNNMKFVALDILDRPIAEFLMKNPITDCESRDSFGVDNHILCFTWGTDTTMPGVGLQPSPSG
jgi:hypothetical protein